jgi:hypothetical protein
VTASRGAPRPGDRTSGELNILALIDALHPTEKRVVAVAVVRVPGPVAGGDTTKGSTERVDHEDVLARREHSCPVDGRDRWRYVMLAHGDFEVAFHGEYREIVPNEQIVTTEVYEGAPDPNDEGALNTITFSEVAGTTTLTILGGA